MQNKNEEKILFWDLLVGGFADRKSKQTLL